MGEEEAKVENTAKSVEGAFGATAGSSDVASTARGSGQGAA